ncbi:MAG: potassium transporter [Gammaproteobacteria bacterium]|nr:potassium transporter [Gammaproteobacteria bacterium]
MTPATEPAAHAALPLLGELLLFCAIAGILIPLVRRFRLSQVLAFLIVGAVIGPYGLGSLIAPDSFIRHFTITDLEGTRAIAEFGVVFLLFTLGLEMSISRLWSMRRWVFGLGNVQILVTAAVIGSLAYAFGNTGGAALVLGLSLALSSTAIVMQLLAERHAIATAVGRVAFAVLLMQDLMVVPLLVLVDHVGEESGMALVHAMLIAAGKAAVAVSAIAVLGKRLVQPLFHRVSSAHQSDAFMALIVLVTLGTAALTWAAGLSLALGAFLAGLLLAETAYRHQVEVTIEPFKGLLISLFFLSVGMGVDLRALAADPLWVPLSILGLFLIKIVLATGALRLFGVRWSTAVEGGFLLGQGGEFAFIVIGIALTRGLLPQEAGQFMLIVVGFSMLAAPAVARLGRWLGGQLESSQDDPEMALDDLPDLSGHVVIAGFGRVGQLLGEILDRERIPYIALDRDASRVRTLSARGASVYFGDAAHPDLLPGKLTEGAMAIVITLDDPHVAAEMAERISRAQPGLPVLARARDEQHAAVLREHGAVEVVPETLEAALQLSGHVLEVLGYNTDAAQHLLQAVRLERQ